MANKKRSLSRSRKRKADPVGHHGYLIKIEDSNGKQYEARIRQNDTGKYEIYDIHRNGAGRKVRGQKITAKIVDKFRHRHTFDTLTKQFCTEQALLKDTLVGKSVIIHESTPYRTKILTGKIVSVLPKITGTPAGEGGLPPDDE